MKKAWKKAVALVLALCAVLGLMLPAAGSTEASASALDAYIGQKGRGYGPVTNLGEPMTDKINPMHCADILHYNNEEFLVAPSRGGMLYIFNLSAYLRGDSEESWIYDAEDIGLNVAFGIDFFFYGTTPTVFVSGGRSLEIYTFSASNDSSKTEHVSYDTFKNANGSVLSKPSVKSVSVDHYGNVFVSVYHSGTGYVYRLIPNYTKPNDIDAYTCELLFYTAEVNDMSSLVAGDNDFVYAQGPIDNNGGAKIYKIHYTTKNQTANTVKAAYFENSEELNYLSYADGKIFGGTGSGTITKNGRIVLDGETLEPAVFKVSDGSKDVTDSTHHLNGVMTAPDANGMHYCHITGVGLCQYDPDTDTATYVSDTNLNSTMRIRRLFQYNNNYYPTTIKANTIYAFRTSNDIPKLSLSGITKNANSRYSTRAVGGGIPGIGSAVYVGGYIYSQVAGFDPNADTPMKSKLFSNTHDQTDSFVAYNDRLYLGCYSGAYLVQFDPSATDDPATTADERVTNLIPEGLKGSHGQLRIHALAAGDDKIFFSTVPTGYDLGGCIGWYDLSDPDDGRTHAERLTIVEEPIKNQILISLAYDEENNILYGASSIYGGSDVTYDAASGVTDYLAKTNAQLMAYYIDDQSTQHSLLGNYSLDGTCTEGSTCKSNIDPQYTYKFDTNTYHSNVKYISGVSIDPDGKLWGNFCNTVFSFTYNKDTRTMNIKQEWADDGSVGDPYTVSNGLNKFPRSFFYDSNGYMYVMLRTGGLYRFNRKNMSADPVIVADESAGFSWSYCMGSDGNIYFTTDYYLYRISLNKVSITEDLIYTMNAKDDASVLAAKSAYNALSPEEQAAIGPSYYQKLQTLMGNECLINGNTYTTLQEALATADSGDTVKLLVSQIGDITVNNGITLDLNGRTIAGNVTVENGSKLDLNGGTVDGSLNAVYGTVTDTTDGQGSVTKTVSLQQDNGKYLPLRDGTVTRFFSYGIGSLAISPDDKNTNQTNFWFDLWFNNQEAYSLLANGSATNLKVRAELYVNGNKIDSDVVFDEKLAQWASENHSGKDNWALYVAVTSDSPRTISVKPYLSANGITVYMDELSAKIGPVAGNAFFAPWPERQLAIIAGPIGDAFFAPWPENLIQ